MLRPLSYAETSVFILAFSVVDRASLNHAIDYFRVELRYQVPDCPILLVGLKTDLRNDEATLDKLTDSIVTPEEAEKVCAEHQFQGYFELSAKTDNRERLEELKRLLVKIGRQGIDEIAAEKPKKRTFGSALKALFSKDWTQICPNFNLKNPFYYYHFLLLLVISHAHSLLDSIQVNRKRWGLAFLLFVLE